MKSIVYMGIILTRQLIAGIGANPHPHLFCLLTVPDPYQY